MGDNRDFNGLQQTVVDLKSKVDDSISTISARLGSHRHSVASLTGVGTIQYAMVASDVTINNSTTLIDIAGMSAALIANATYTFEGFVVYSGNATANAKFQLSSPSGAAGYFSAFGVAQAAGNYIGSLTAYTTTDLGGGDTIFTSGAPSGFIAARPAGIITTVGTSGLLQFRFAQSTANASNTVVKAGSWLRTTRIA